MTAHRASALEPVAENSLPGLRPRNQTSRRGVKLAKSNRASGLRARVRPEGVGDSCHRWYEPQTGRYTRADPLSKISRNFGQGLLLTRPEPLYAYARANPIAYFDPLGLASVDRALCVTKWIAAGAGVGAGVGGAVGATAAGGACTFVAPGVGTIGCGAGGASGGAAGGGAIGGAIGGLFGSLFCSDACEADTDERRKTHEHCLRLYEICVSNSGRHRFIDGARCDSCFASCKAQGAWPFERCQLNYYPHGM